MSALRTRIDALRAEAAKIRTIVSTSEAAAGMEYVCTAVLAALAETERAEREVTVREFAALHHVGVQTVRDWLRRGEIAETQHRRTAGGHVVIRANATRRKRAVMRLEKSA